MTIEEKVREIILNLYIVADDNLCRGLRQFDSGDKCRVDRATQDIFALIKPMSREKLIKLIADYKCGRPFVHRNDGNHIGDENAEGIADAILAEWGKE